MPAEIEQLKQRIAELSYRLDRTEPDPMFADLGVQRDVYPCAKCGYETFKQHSLS